MNLPDLAVVPSLQTLSLRGCSNLSEVPELTELSLLQKLDLWNCSELKAVPDVSQNASLTVPAHLDEIEDRSAAPRVVQRLS